MSPPRGRVSIAVGDAVLRHIARWLDLAFRSSDVVARYGGNFRGYKGLFAEERGAVGVIMFNDAPAEEVEPYPDGPMLNGDIIQRGSVLTLPWTGDPLTPFVPALPVDGDRQVERLDPSEVPLHTIPVPPPTAPSFPLAATRHRPLQDRPHPVYVLG